MAAAEPKQLTREIVTASSWRHVVAIVASVLFLVAVLNFAAVWYLARWSPNIGYLLIAAKWNILHTLNSPVDLLIVGDSSGNQGVDPKKIQSELGLSSVNLCTIGDAMVLDGAYMLDDYIARYGAPRKVLVIHAYDIWSRPGDISVLAQIPGSWWNQQPKITLTPKQRVKVILNRYVPFYTQSISLGYVLQNPWNAFRHDLTLEPDGFMEEDTADPGRVVKDAAVHLQFVREGVPVMSEWNRAALKHMVDLADRYQFDLFVANSPVYDSLYADSAFQVYYAKVQAAIDEIVRGHRAYHLLNPPMIFPASEMQSVDHVIYDAALRYTARIADEIRRTDIRAY